MGTEIDQNGRRYRDGVGYRRIEIRKNRQCRSKLMDDFKLSQQPTRHPLPAKDSAEKEWNGDEEDEKKKVKKMRIHEENTTEVHQDIPSGRCCVASIQQLLLRYSACNIFRGHEGHSARISESQWQLANTCLMWFREILLNMLNCEVVHPKMTKYNLIPNLQDINKLSNHKRIVKAVWWI